MGSMVSGLADAVLGAAEGAGLSGDTVARYGKCCEAVVEFCGRQGFDALSGSVVDEFAACQQERARHGEIGRNRRNALVKTARMDAGVPENWPGDLADDEPGPWPQRELW